jgi:hypothetical protein
MQYHVNIKPAEVSKILSETELKTLINIIDKCLLKGVKLELELIEIPFENLSILALQIFVEKHLDLLPFSKHLGFMRDTFVKERSKEELIAHCYQIKNLTK